MNAVFSDIVKVAQGFMSMLDPNIVIDKDPNASCGLLFKRIDIKDSTWLPVKKMSGGEKVKTGLALVFALNTITIPEFGVILLDEPSTHLCEKSKQALLELFSEGLRKSGFSGFQIIAVDHAEILIPGFEIVHQL
jgi:DNA repair exonuclease SbcCD ATPase subunit